MTDRDLLDADAGYAALLRRAEEAEAEVVRLRDWRPAAIKWFGQLRDIAKAASVGNDHMADVVACCAWAESLLTKGGAHAKTPMPLDWNEAVERVRKARADEAPSPPPRAEGSAK